MITPQSSVKIALGVALMSLVLWGCDSAGTSQSGEGISIEPEQMQYTLDPDAQSGISIVNTSARTLYLPVCGPDLTFVVERFESGTWENYSAGLCLAMYAMGYRRTAEPGDSVRVTTRIEEEGRYRVGVSYKTSRDEEEPKTVRSDGFVVRANS
jgi:hypothetical protein